jgi:hypothetical protein
LGSRRSGASADDRDAPRDCANDGAAEIILPASLDLV